MAWVYLDDQFPDHPKVVAAGGDAAWLFVCGLAYCKRYGTEGVIPKAQVKRLTDRKSPGILAKKLQKVGLLEDHGDAYHVHDYAEWNRSQMSRSQAGRKAANARWNKGNADASRNANASPTHSERNATRNANASESHMPQHAHSLSPPQTTTSPKPSPRSTPVDNERTGVPPAPQLIDDDEVF